MGKQLIFFLGCLLLLLLAIALVYIPLHRRVRLPVLLSVLAIPVVACLLYWHWGSSGALFAHWQKQKDHKLAMAYLKQQKSPQVIVDQFKQKLEAQPNQPKGWFLLGNIYVKQNKLKMALAAYNKARHYDSHNVDYLVAVCQADMALHQVTRSANHQALLLAVKAHPNNPSLRYMLAFDAFSRKDYHQARKQWELVLKQLPVESPDAKRVLALIGKAQGFLSEH